MERETEIVHGGREREYAAEGDRESIWREYTSGGERERVGIWRKRHSENMEDLLHDAAYRGDLELLQGIIAKNKCILDKVLVGGFKGKNPLHVAIATGQEDIVGELLRSKPELAEVLDTELGAAPLHVACSKGNLEIVTLLAQISPGMCLARDREGNNPLHIAAMKGKVKVLEILLQTRPNSGRVTTDRGDTILHLCVNYNQFESLKLLIRMVRGDQEFFNSTDSSGNNILHLAVFCNQYEVIEHVLLNTKIDVNARNESGWTALEIHSQVATSQDPNSVDYRIKAALTTAGAKRCSELLIPFDPSWQKKKKSTLMIVSSLMATMAFQVGVNPPSGVWQDKAAAELVGTAIIGHTNPIAYALLMYLNTIGFLLCFTTIFDIILVLPADKQDSGFARSGFLRFWFSWLTIMTVVFVYTFSVLIVTPYDIKDPNYFIHAIILTVMVWCILVSSMGRAPFKVRLATGVVILISVACLVGYFESPLFGGLYFAASLAVAGVVLLMIHKRRRRNNSIEPTAATRTDTASAPIPNAVGENDSSKSRLIGQAEEETTSDPEILVQN